jgi:transposase
MGNGTFVGLDVHARSVVAGLIDEDTGEVRVTRAPHRTGELVGWLEGLAGPVQVTYEAGPTGFGLARACQAAGIECLVAAPSLIARSSAGRGRKSDVSDAEQLARLLRRGELTGVRVHDPVDEAARDLVRAREDARADLMRARHRLSELLLRHGLVYEQGRAWTLAHDAWLRVQQLEHPGARAAFEDYYGAVLGAGLRRDALDGQIEQMAADPRFAPVVGRLSCLRGVGTLTAFVSRSATSIASPVARSGPTWAWCPASPSREPATPAGRSPRPATATPGGFWSRPPGTTAALCARAR